MDMSKPMQYPHREKADAKAKANPHMPHFTLLASDPDAPKTVRNWAAHHAMRPGAKPSKVDEAYAIAADMERWRTVECDDVFDDAMPAWLYTGWTGGFVCGALASLGLFAFYLSNYHG